MRHHSTSAQHWTTLTWTGMNICMHINRSSYSRPTPICHSFQLQSAVAHQLKGFVQQRQNKKNRCACLKTHHALTGTAVRYEFMSGVHSLCSIFYHTPRAHTNRVSHEPYMTEALIWSGLDVVIMCELRVYISAEWSRFNELNCCLFFQCSSCERRWPWN